MLILIRQYEVIMYTFSANMPFSSNTQTNKAAHQQMMISVKHDLLILHVVETYFFLLQGKLSFPLTAR